MNINSSFYKPTLFTEAELLVWFSRRVKNHACYAPQRTFCKDFDLSEQQLSRILAGKDPIPKRVLRSLNVSTHTYYLVGGNA
ncbi:MAG TPA: hypothetical protein PLK61_09070 [Nitrosomonas sp.]|nr:hypothetical protein [Nitrosomonas sp.]